VKEPAERLMVKC